MNEYFSVDPYARAVYSALMVDLDEVEYEKYSWRTVDGKSQREVVGKAKRRPDESEIEVYAFPQTWGSTALGFGGIGGSAMTTAQTVVVLHGREACVYFAGRFAYKIRHFNDAFWEDVRNHDMKGVGGAIGKYDK